MNKILQDNKIYISLLSIDKNELYSRLIKNEKKFGIKWLDNKKEAINTDCSPNYLSDILLNNNKIHWFAQKDQSMLKCTLDENLNLLVEMVPHYKILIDSNDQHEYLDLSAYLQLILNIMHNIAYTQMISFNDILGLTKVKHINLINA